MVATLQFLRELLGNEFALPVPVVGFIDLLDLLVADGQLTSPCATVEHSLFTNWVAHPPAIYVTVAMEYLQNPDVRYTVV